nr:hypothetical protein GCM10017745_55150 [Saccharothrix mutabilis subsp. capreolus]
MPPEPEPAARPAPPAPVLPEPAPAVHPAPAEPAPGAAPASRRGQVVDLGVHAGLFGAAQAGLAVFDLSWVRDLLTRDLGTVLLGQVPREGAEAFLYGAGRVWALVLVADIAWTSYKLLTPRVRG